ncbi:hypothetical protein [Trinickia soli]|uniref:hypothetical protein n=1 Tax=Trinickia soli TaxID=380675 RepID=UPI0014673BD7|nr:hypothetical protein [Trinickia soli]CAB3711636.1 hypothetical protein LMG24076_04031 [Trinickia soli]
MKKEVTAEDRFEEVSRMVMALKGIAYGASVASDHSVTNEGLAISGFSGGVQVICEVLEERMELLWQAMSAEKADAEDSSQSEVSHAKAESGSHAVLAAA